MLKAILLFLLTMGTALVPGISFADDNFSSDLIDGSKWRYQEHARYVDHGKGVLRIIARTDSQEEVFRSSFPLSNPQSVAGVKTEVILRNLSITKNDGNAHAEARLYGVFYNTQTAPSGSRGEVWAEVAITDRGSGLEAFWCVKEVADDEGSHSNTLGEGTLVAPGTLTLGATYILGLVYDEPGQQIRFAIHDIAGTQMANAAFAIDNRQSPANQPDWLLSAAAYDDSGYVDVEFDNVYTKTTANDDFSLYDTFDHFDASKWDTSQKTRMIEDGTLILMAQSLGESQYTISAFQDNPDYIETEVTISSESDIPAGDRGSARIDGYYYNDSVPINQQTGSKGNVFATIAIEDQAGDLSARCYLLKMLDDDAKQEETIWEQSFEDISIQYDTTYTLTLEYTHTALIFSLSDGVNTRSHTYTIPDTSSVYAPHSEYRCLRTRLCGCGNTGGGLMKATFDNVVTTPGDNDDEKKSSGGGGGGCLISTLLSIH
jgi:hypothetical protein